LLPLLLASAEHTTQSGHRSPLLPARASASEHQIIQPVVQRRVGRRQTPAVSAALCEPVHNHLRSSGAEYGFAEGASYDPTTREAHTPRLTIDLLVIVVSLAIIGIFTAID
jgi:hypothetical protein